MKKLFVVLVIIITHTWGTLAQQTSKWISLEGKVMSITVNSPIKARLMLESLPYGSDNRIFYSDQSSGQFSFKVKEGRKYRVRVTAEGYLTATDTITIMANMDSLVYKLVPSGENTLLRLNINFAQSKAAILEDSYEELDKLIALLRDYPKMEIQLEGHTDFRGSATANMRLSEQRVVSVENYIAGRGINEKRIRTKAFGGTKPITKENSDEAKLLNRRVEARILKTE